MESVEKELRTGVCMGCGQIKTVRADSQEDADVIATEECSCSAGELLRKERELDQRLSELIGEEAPDHGWEAAGSADIYEAIRTIGHIVAEGGIESVGIRIDKTNLKIGARGGKIVVERSKTVRQGGVIDK